MPRPTASDVHQNAALSMISIAWMQSLDYLVSGQVFPECPVNKQSDVIFEFNADFWRRNQAGIRAPGTVSRGGGYDVNFDKNYFCKEHAFHHDMPKEVLENADIANYEAAATQFVTWQIYMDRELDWVTNHWTDPTAGYGTTWWNKKDGVNAAPGADEFLQWDDAASVPVTDLRQYMREIQKETGFRPNKLVLGPEVFDWLQINPQLKAYLSYSPGTPSMKPLVTEEMMAALLRIDQVLVGEMSYTASADGAAAITYEFAFDKQALLVYAAPSPQVMMPTGGYNFVWNKMGQYNPGIEKWWEQNIKSTRIEGTAWYDHKLLGPTLGIMCLTAVA